MINDPYGVQTAVRSPRLRVVCNGQTILGAIKASTTSNNYYQADHFTVEFAASATPTTWWDTDPPLMLDIQFSLDGTAWQSLIVGEVDHQDFDPVTGLLSMEGRDLSARLIEAKTQEAFLNSTSSEVAAKIAALHPEFTSTRITKTTTLVGRYYEADHSKVTLDQFSRTTTEWDLLVYLARLENFDVFVQGTTLVFQPAVDPSADPFVINWTPPSPVPRLNAVTMKFQRSLTLAKDIQVDVRSWNSRNGRAFTKTSRAIGGKASSAGAVSHGKSSSVTQRFVYVIPNLSEDAAQKKANQLAHEHSLHERVVQVEQPGELTSLTPRNMVRIQGTGTSWDQSYYVASIDRSISFDDGFHESIRLKNSSPRTQTQV
jgi:phage protein D